MLLQRNVVSTSKYGDSLFQIIHVITKQILETGFHFVIFWGFDEKQRRHQDSMNSATPFCNRTLSVTPALTDVNVGNMNKQLGGLLRQDLSLTYWPLIPTFRLSPFNG